MKHCRACGETKPLEAFPRHKQTRDGRNTYCQSCTSEKATAWMKARPESVSAYNRKYTRRTAYAAQRAYEARNPEAVVAAKAAWKKRHPDQVRIQGVRHAAKRRALQMATIVDLVDYELILVSFGRQCHICQAEIKTDQKLEFDHVIPLCRGGHHTASNIRPSHRSCNRRKGARLMEEMVA
jgi:5-methylcytosine-specific restriction endonuclease McrA